jgi:hypothetical protein
MSGLLPLFGSPGYYFGDPVGISAYAIDRTNAADDFIRRLGITAASLTPPVITPVFPAVVAAPTPQTATAPTMQPVVWTSPNPPASFSGSLTIDQYLPEPFDVDPPVLAFGAAPAPFSEAAPDAPGINLQFEYPTLEVSLPVSPEFLTLQTHSFAGVDMPTLDAGDVPVLSLVAPSITTYTPGSNYTSALLEAVKATLQDRIENGGTGLSPAVENAIWDRGREREMRQAADALAELDRMESLGYALPPGVYTDARLKIQTEMGYAIAGHSREVMIKAAELEQNNVIQAINSTVQLEGALINYNNAVEQRLFESTKYATEAGIEIYNAQVRAYAAYLDAYKTKVDIYKALVQGELAKVEAYKAEIAAEEAKARVNVALVERYKVEAEVALSAIEIFKAHIGAITAKAEIEKLKVMTFGEQVRAYGAKVNAYTAGVEGFRASIQAEGAKQEAFKSTVEAYTAQVTAAVKTAEAKIEEFKGLIVAKTQEWDAYKAAYTGEAERARAIAATNTTAADTYRTTVTGLSAYNETLTKQWQVALDTAERVTEVGVAAARVNAELYMTTRSLASDASKVGAQVSAQLGAAALNAIHWGQSYQTSFSVGNSDQVSHSYNYNF